MKPFLAEVSPLRLHPFLEYSTWENVSFIVLDVGNGVMTNRRMLHLKKKGEIVNLMAVNETKSMSQWHFSLCLHNFKRTNSDGQFMVLQCLASSCVCDVALIHNKRK